MAAENTEQEKTEEKTEENTDWYGRVGDVFRSLKRSNEDKGGKGEWETFLAEAGFEMGDSAENALRPLSREILEMSAFSDMPADAQWITPGHPARSALYHLLASPDAAPDLPAPTRRQLETVENAVYAARNFSVDDLYAHILATMPDCHKDENKRPILRVVVFACEYRASGGTPHNLYADMCYARTGVARTGTIRQPYDAASRSYPFTCPTDPFHIPTLPARYAALWPRPSPGRLVFSAGINRVGISIWISGFPSTNCFPVRTACRD